jgi:uncharacterized protein (DUF924 family)
MNTQLAAVLAFWFTERTEDDWFAAGAELDAEIRERFGELHSRVGAGEFWRERTGAQAYLAEVLVLDQFSRHIYRGSGWAFAYDGMALTLAQHAIALGHHQHLAQLERLFLYLPFMHSESRAIHGEAVTFFESIGHPKSLEMEHIHKDIIDRFGRYPHRNAALGRVSTTAEVKYLANTEEAFF